MPNYGVSISKANEIRQKIAESSRRVNQQLQQYTEAKKKLLSIWQGPLREDFVQKNQTKVEDSCRDLVTSLSKLSNSVETVKADLVNRQKRAAERLHK